MIKYLVADCDGVLTDGKYYSDEHGKKFVAFNAHDSNAIQILKKSQIKFFILTSSSVPKIAKRKAKDWGVECHWAAPFNKLLILTRLVNLTETAYIGDSIDDIPVLDSVALSLVPFDAPTAVKSHAKHILETKGGGGCLLAALFLIDDLMAAKTKKINPLWFNDD